jgi:hypothetical protein
MPAPPDKRRRRQGQLPAPSRTPNGYIAEGQLSLVANPDRRPGDPSTDGRVVDLDERRARRLSRPWPGWWGGHELSTWTWAERSRTAERPRKRCCA